MTAAAPSEDAKKTEKPAGANAAESTWRRRARWLVFWAIILQLIGFAIFAVALVLGETSRVTMLALYLPRLPFLIMAVIGAALAPFTRRRVRLLLAVQIALALIVLFPVMGFTLGHSRSAAAGAAERPIRLATYNMYFGKLDRRALLEEISAMDVDILLLQATYDSLGDLQKRFPDRSTNRVDDFVIVTRFKIQKVEEPPALADGELPKFVGYVLEMPNGQLLRVYNIHPFSPRHALFEDEETRANIKHREAQVEAVVWAARNDGPPFIIAGDTNLPPGSAIARRHFGRFKDAFDEVGFGFGYTFPAKRPWMRIDRVFAADDNNVRFLDARVGALGASDHRPLFVDFELVQH